MRGNKDIYKFKPKKSYERDGINLTKKNLELVGYLTKGLSNQAIAKELEITDKAVKAQITYIYKKLHVKSRGEFFALLLRLGSEQFSLQKALDKRKQEIYGDLPTGF